MTTAIGPHRPLTAPTLTDDQTALLRLRAAGHTRARISRTLHTCDSQITKHLNAVQTALGADSRAQMIAFGLLHGILNPGQVITRQVAQPICLTPRQRQVLAVYAGGGNDQDAAASMGISPSTVREYARALLRTLGARDRAHAVGLALVYEVLLLSELDPDLPPVTLAEHTKTRGPAAAADSPSRSRTGVRTIG
ncbi:helix-turn-helix transcriptional regulator [Kitasatospora sp. RB6PN24]|uniref:helix-turn-helix transcriptional regulator n=1 Tax=Kitasatospora humi TaxID=2893891 RepID=UPI001E2BBD7D|nr:helix-turn-helix transcriptional regulator [Kitasatospora humi]MCC9309157.1 helix-turn-helix transcriptional regulator [Kitasatospora humi]